MPRNFDVTLLKAIVAACPGFKASVLMAGCKLHAPSVAPGLFRSQVPIEVKFVSCCGAACRARRCVTNRTAHFATPAEIIEKEILDP